jgi:Transglycosylase SLT domain
MFDAGRAGGGRSRLSTWQKAAAIVPLALLTGSLTSAVGNATNGSSDDGSQVAIDPGMPVVPTTPFKAPASIQLNDDSLPSGIDPNAGPNGTLSTLSQQGIPTAALVAYQRAETVLAEADPACNLDWPLVAAIGRVESDHGRANGNVLGSDGVSRPGIYGPRLDGASSTARIPDSDNGSYDHDTVWDRAVGPMQFIPGTWQVVAVDGDSDGVKNPQDIDDAALATAVYLCAGYGDLSTDPGARAAVYRYNHSSDYVNLVMSIAGQYTMGNYTMVPNGTTSPTVLTDVDHDADQGGPGHHHGPVISAPGHANSSNHGGPDHNSDGPGHNGTSDGPTNGSPGGNPTGPHNGGGSNGGHDGNSGGGGLNNVPNDAGHTVDNAVEILDTLAEATQWCQQQLAGKPGISPADIQTCAKAVVGQTVDQAAKTLNGLLDTLVGDVVCGLLGCQKNGG